MTKLLSVLIFASSAILARTHRDFNRHFDVWGATGPKYDDVAQGQLGTCYFLASISALANAQPQVIENMFVDRDRWQSGVYTVQWPINGLNTRVAVNAHVPTDLTQRHMPMPFFVQTNNGEDVWPLILEKAWAKIFGSFLAVERGQADMAFRALTGAPVQKIQKPRDDTKKDNLWLKLLEAMSNKFPVTARTTVFGNPLNLAGAHVFVVVEIAKDKDGFGKAVHIYNPWGTRNKYCGKIPSDPTQGNFWMTFDEYAMAFGETTIVRVKPDYLVSAKEIHLVNAETSVALQFIMKTNRSFSVGMEWPSPRFFKGCSELTPDFFMAVAKEDDLKDSQYAGRGSTKHNVRIDMPGGEGVYVVFVKVNFAVDEAWLESIVVNTYAAETTELTIIENRWKHFRRMAGVCDKIDVKINGKPHQFEAKDETFVDGYPILVNSKTETPEFKIMYFDGAHEKHRQGGQISDWKIINTVEEGEAGTSYLAEVSVTQCDGVSLLQAGETTQEFGELIQEGTEVLRRKTHTLPVFLESDSLTKQGIRSRSGCEDLLHRLRENGENLLDKDVTKDEDPKFPSMDSSIGEPNAICGVTAEEAADLCSNYNNWLDFTSIFTTRAQTILQAKQCLKGEVENDQCWTANICPWKVRFAHASFCSLEFCEDAMSVCEQLNEVLEEVPNFKPDVPQKPECPEGGGGLAAVIW